MYADILINGRSTIAMVDIDTTYNFILAEEMSILGLTLEKGKLHMKAMNSEAKKNYRAIQNIVVKIKGWLEFANFSVVLMNNFKMILGVRSNQISYPRVHHPESFPNITSFFHMDSCINF